MVQRNMIKGKNKLRVYRPGRAFRFVPSTDQVKDLPDKPGEYRILNRRGIILYIGETCNIKRRIGEHMRTGKIKKSKAAGYIVDYKIADARSSSEQRRVHERQKIAEHAPRLNCSKGGEGRIATKNN